MHAQDETIGIVLAGGGARGAYEIGALSELLPALEAEGRRPTLFTGTSVGALNASWLAANAQLPTDELIDAGTALWRDVRWDDVLAPVWSLRSVLPLLRYAALGVPGVRLDSLLDDTPLQATVQRLVDVAQLETNVAHGTVDAAAVVATASRSGRSVVFHAGGPQPPADDWRGIDYVPHRLTHEHVRASAAIPAAFRPVRVTAPPSATGWYVDGGTRLNTPIKPAIALGADRLIIVALNTTRPRPPQPDPPDGAPEPDVFEGLGHVTQAVLADPLANDVRTLATINELATHGATHHRVIPYILVQPSVRDRIGEIARDVYRKHYASLSQARTSVGAFGRLVHADASPATGELLSYFFFAREFAEALMTEGAKDARAWLDGSHDDALWQTGRQQP